MQLNLPDYLLADVISTVVFGIIAILLIVFGYATFDKLTPQLDFNDLINKGNTAIAIVVGAFILGLCYVIGRVVAAILGA